MAEMAHVATLTDAAEFKARQDEAGFNRALLVRIGDATPDMIYAKDLGSRMMFANAAVLANIGRSWDEIRGRSDIEWHDDPVEAAKFVAADARIMATGIGESVEEVLTGPVGPRVFQSAKTPMRDAGGNVIGICGISRDITAEKAAEAQRQLLLAEMNHRVKNSLTAVMAIARQTLRNEASDATAWQGFEARIMAMARANDMLAGDHWAGADIASVVGEALGPHGPVNEGRIHIAGPDVDISAYAVVSLSLALHELATNATKYGALSLPQGRVDISWRLVDGAEAPMLAVDWCETDGPLVQVPHHRGFGTRLIERAFGNNGQRARILFRPQGVQCQLLVALATDGDEGQPEQLSGSALA
ncbi:PAS domain S-box protein [Polymorphobacter arshaanensis]|uniref:histidine kinase n=1 Tax=Glacieibacterium arshaanense TaxID=2511025 RepID=A0A4Y9EML3_9SPHN|nr:HWE histidine kinase domain-containing protein [Polymorphobacter arshaanensis]TFU03073.1 PAS domain S-box protein [Polymorphobacter arshaanensis]